MKTVAEIVSSLRKELAQSSEENKLLAFVRQTLDELREKYKSEKSSFSAQEITFLSEVSRTVGITLQDFIDALEEASVIQYQEDAQEVAIRFSEIAERLSPYLVAKRAQKEARELIEKFHELPSRKTGAAETRLKQLEHLAPICPIHKEHGKMKLRESQFGVFWGCDTFPLCFGKRSLTKKERFQLWGDASI